MTEIQSENVKKSCLHKKLSNLLDTVTVSLHEEEEEEEELTTYSLSEETLMSDSDSECSSIESLKSQSSDNNKGENILKTVSRDD